MKLSVSEGRAICSVVILHSHGKSERLVAITEESITTSRSWDKEIFNAISQASFPVVQENENAHSF